MIYRYHPKPWHFSGPVFLGLLCWSVLHRFGVGLDLVFLACVIGFAGLCWSVWIALAGIIQAGIDYHVETGQEWTPPTETVYEHTQVTQESDPRWRDWAAALCNGKGLARAGWVGFLKPFSRREYDRKMSDLKIRRVLRFVNGKTADNGYTVNGAGGWEYIKAMSEGRRLLPLPHRDDLDPTAQNKNTAPTHPPQESHQSGGGGENYQEEYEQ